MTVFLAGNYGLRPSVFSESPSLLMALWDHYYSMLVTLHYNAVMRSYSSLQRTCLAAATYYPIFVIMNHPLTIHLIYWEEMIMMTLNDLLHHSDSPITSPL
jgi:hypothetical protein